MSKPKKKKRIEQIIKIEMDGQINEAYEENKKKLKEKDITKLTVSFSFGITPQDIKAILNRYVSRRAIEASTAANLLISLCGNGIELLEDVDLKGDLSADNRKKKIIDAKKRILKRLGTEYFAKGLWVKVREG